MNHLLLSWASHPSLFPRNPTPNSPPKQSALLTPPPHSFSLHSFQPLSPTHFQKSLPAYFCLFSGPIPVFNNNYNILILSYYKRLEKNLGTSNKAGWLRVGLCCQNAKTKLIAPLFINISPLYSYFIDRQCYSFTAKSAVLDLSSCSEEHHGTSLVLHMGMLWGKVPSFWGSTCRPDSHYSKTSRNLLLFRWENATFTSLSLTVQLQELSTQIHLDRFEPKKVHKSTSKPHQPWILSQRCGCNAGSNRSGALLQFVYV